MKKQISDTQELTVAIVGGGFSGAMTAVNILRSSAKKPIKVILIEKAEQFGLGLAYSTIEESHYLNVAIGNMSALPDEPDNLLNFVRQQNKDATWDSFITRKLYGSYVQHLLSEFAKSAQSATLELVKDRVTGISASPDQAEQYVCHLQSGKQLKADKIVFALGNGKPVVPERIRSAFDGDHKLIADPWDRKAMGEIGPDETVLFIGTGLTMVDKVLELEARKHRGPIHAISRRGLLPHAHKRDFLFRGSPPLKEPFTAKTVREGLRWIRSMAAQEADWRAVVDGLRPYGQAWWKSLPLAEKRRFARHAQSYWDVHRHRMAPEVAATMQKILDSKQLLVHAGHLSSCKLNDRNITVEFRERHSHSLKTLTVNRIVICTGPDTRPEKQTDPLFASLVSEGIISANELKSGILVDENLNLIDSDGRTCKQLFAVGPPLRGTFFETIAVPELRQQASIVAKEIIKVAQITSGAAIK